MRIALVDTVYPEVLRHMPVTGDYATSLRSAHDFAFGTSDFFSRNLRALGHECLDLIANHRDLQQQWARENDFSGASLPAIALQQIEAFKPDCVFMQDLNFFDSATLRYLGEKYTLAGQCSCPLPKPAILTRYDVIFSSLPKHVEYFKSFGVRAEYLPLAFEHTLLDRIPPQERDIDVSFVGGLGASLHWKAGTHAFERLAEAIGPRFQWYGYGVERLPKDSPLRQCYRGELYGLEMYKLYGRSKIVVNRHAELAQGYTNNLRVYEGAGMGAMMLTETSENLFELFHELAVNDYSSVEMMLHEVHESLKPEHKFILQKVAKFGQDTTLRRHTYAHRMPIVAEVLTECLKQAA